MADKDKIPTALKSHVSINQEYLHAFRTQSYLDFHELLLLNTLKSPNNYKNATTTPTMQETLLQPRQHLIPSILNTSSINPSSSLKHLILRYFDTSACASRICSQLLTSITQSHSNYQLIQTALMRLTSSSFSSPDDQYKHVVSELNSFSLLRNPFLDPNPDDFSLICDQLSSVLSSLNSKRKKGLTMRMRLMFRSRLIVRKVRDQLDVAAKGAYIVSRDMDTMSRIVGHIREEVRHKKEMIRYCLERTNNSTHSNSSRNKKGERVRVEEVVKELRKEGRGFERQVEELEKHVCLCLVNINRARVLLIKEMAKP